MVSRQLLPRLASNACSRGLLGSLPSARKYATVTQPSEPGTISEKDTAGSSKSADAPVSRMDLGLSRLGRIVDNMQREVDTLTKTFVGKGFQAASSPSFGLHIPTEVPTSITQGTQFPSRAPLAGAKRLPADCFEDKRAYTVKADVPGM